MTAIHKTAHALASIGPGSCAGPQQYPSDREGKKAALLSAVEGIREAATGYAHEAESQATLPAVLVDALASSGLWTMKLPAELGGAEADPVTHIEVIEAASAIEPSVGWCLMVGATSIGLPGAFLPDAAIAEMFAGGRSPRAAMAAMPAGTAVPVSDGYRLSGRWPFASGVRHAQWITLGARVLRGVDRRPELRMMVLPTAAVQIHDNWDVAGLEGTGSCDVSVADYVVPEQFTWDTVDAKPLRGGPLYRLKRPGFFALSTPPLRSVWAGGRLRRSRAWRSQRAAASRLPRPAWKRARPFRELSGRATCAFVLRARSSWMSTRRHGPCSLTVRCRRRVCRWRCAALPRLPRRWPLTS